MALLCLLCCNKRPLWESGSVLCYPALFLPRLSSLQGAAISQAGFVCSRDWDLTRMNHMSHVNWNGPKNIDFVWLGCLFRAFEPAALEHTASRCHRWFSLKSKCLLKLWIVLPLRVIVHCRSGQQSLMCKGAAVANDSKLSALAIQNESVVIY